MGKLDAITFDELLARENPFETRESRISLEGMTFVSPAAMVQLAAACHALVERGKTPLVVVGDPGVRSYLVRAGFITAVVPTCRIEPEITPYERGAYGGWRGSNPMLVEVTKLEAGGELPPLLDRVVDVLRERLRYGKRNAYDVAIAVSEICQNTFDHNQRPCGFVAMQVYGRGKKRFLEIGVADYGDGVRQTLRKNPKNRVPENDIEAIRLATTSGVSEHDDPTRGNGLYRMLEIAFEHEGAVQIRSGEAKVRFRMDKRRGWEFPVPWMPGVQVVLNLPTRRRVDRRSFR